MKKILGEKLYSVKEIAEILGVSYPSVNNYVKQKKLKANTIGGRKYFTEKSLRAFLQL